MNQVHSRQSGAVSLFIVIFSAILIVTIVTAFVRIMIANQQQATAGDLSKSALDSAYVGVEDAKRAIVAYYKNACSAKPDGVDLSCDALRGDIAVNDGWTQGCNATVKANVATSASGSEVRVRSNNSSNDDSFNQAYTCVKVQMYPKDYVGLLKSETARIIRLKSYNNSPFAKIKVQWFSQNGQNLDLDTCSSATSSPVPSAYCLPKDWPKNRPAVLRVQLLQFGNTVNINNFDDPNYNSTLFLLPSTKTQPLTPDFSGDFRRSSVSSSAQQVKCNSTPTSSRYACEATINLPIWTDPSQRRNAYLNIAQYYSAANTDFSITLLDQSNIPVRFADVQPVVDSTGRADSIFRRIRSRIDIDATGIPIPVAAVDVTKSLCKEFIVTDSGAYHGPTADCPPLP